MREVAIFYIIQSDQHPRHRARDLPPVSEIADADQLLNLGLTILNDILALVKPIPAANAQAKSIGWYNYAAAQIEDVYMLDLNGPALPISAARRRRF